MAVGSTSAAPLPKKYGSWKRTEAGVHPSSMAVGSIVGIYLPKKYESWKQFWDGQPKKCGGWKRRRFSEPKKYGRWKQGTVTAPKEVWKLEADIRTCRQRSMVVGSRLLLTCPSSMAVGSLQREILTKEVWYLEAYCGRRLRGVW